MSRRKPQKRVPDTFNSREPDYEQANGGWVTDYYQQNWFFSCAAAAIQNVLYMIEQEYNKEWDIPGEWIVRLFLELAMDNPNPAGYSQNWNTQGTNMHAVEVALNNLLAGTDVDIRYKLVNPGEWDICTLADSVAEFSAPAVFTHPSLLDPAERHCVVFAEYEAWGTHEWWGRTETTSWCWLVDTMVGAKGYTPEYALHERLRSGIWAG